MEAHLAVIAALRTRDPALAAAAMADHIQEARNRALGL
jgi:DNA-binding GntR family transcriptional regulator